MVHYSQKCKSLTRSDKNKLFPLIDELLVIYSTRRDEFRWDTTSYHRYEGSNATREKVWLGDTGFHKRTFKTSTLAENQNVADEIKKVLKETVPEIVQETVKKLMDQEIKKYDLQLKTTEQSAGTINTEKNDLGGAVYNVYQDNSIMQLKVGHGVIMKYNSLNYFATNLHIASHNEAFFLVANKRIYFNNVMNNRSNEQSLILYSTRGSAGYVEPIVLYPLLIANSLKCFSKVHTGNGNYAQYKKMAYYNPDTAVWITTRSFDGSDLSYNIQTKNGHCGSPVCFIDEMGNYILAGLHAFGGVSTHTNGATSFIGTPTLLSHEVNPFLEWCKKSNNLFMYSSGDLTPLGHRVKTFLSKRIRC